MYVFACEQRRVEPGISKYQQHAARACARANTADLCAGMCWRARVRNENRRLVCKCALRAVSGGGGGGMEGCVLESMGLGWIFWGWDAEHRDDGFCVVVEMLQQEQMVSISMVVVPIRVAPILTTATKTTATRRRQQRMMMISMRVAYFTPRETRGQPQIHTQDLIRGAVGVDGILCRCCRSSRAASFAIATVFLVLVYIYTCLYTILYILL